jgi:tetratricopeptide (TPR) repeat protein
MFFKQSLILLYLTFFSLVSHSKIQSLGDYRDNVSDSTTIIHLLIQSDQLMGSNPKEALKKAQEAYAIALQTADNKNYLKTKMQVGRILFYQGIYKTALQIYLQMLELAEEENDQEWLGKSLYQLGSIRLVLEDYKEALGYFNKAKSILDSYYQDKGGLSKAIQTGFHNNFGVIYSGLKDFDNAIKEFKTGIKIIADDSSLQNNKVQLINNLGDVYYKSGEYQKALDEYQNGLEQIQNYPNPLFEAMLYNSLGKTYLALKNNEEALKHYQLGLDIAKKTNGLSILKHINEGLAQTYEALNKKDAAYVYLQTSKSYEDSLNIKKTSEKMLQAELLADFKAEKMNLSNTWKKYQHSFLLVLICLTILLLVLYIRYRFQKKNILSLNTEKQIIEQKITTSEIETNTLKAQLTENDKKLALISMKNLQTEAFIDLLAKKLPQTDAPLHQQNLEQIQHSLKSLQSSKGLTDFEYYFEGLYIGFFEKIQSHFPNLTANERRLCAFLKLQMNSKEIASVTGQSVRAVEIARTRLRKKLGITKAETSLNDFFKDY